MKLNPPDSSSDLQVARTIAQRLHRRAHGGEAAEPPSQEVAATPPRATTPPPAAAAPLPPAVPSPALAPPPSEPREAEPSAGERPAPKPRAPQPEPAVTPPVLEAPEPELPLEEPPAAPGTPPAAWSPEPAVPELPLEEAPRPELVGSETPPAAWRPGQDLPEAPPWEDIGGGEEKTAPGGHPADALADLAGPSVSEPDLDALHPPPLPASAAQVADVSPEDLLGDAPPEAEGWPGPSPFDAEDETASSDAEAAVEGLVEAEAPTWDSVADSCLALAQASGAMLIDPSGQVLSARGEWPDPGPDAIASRLVSMMDRTLRDAPTRSVSAPLAGRHLTAWRVPVSDGYFTTVFMGDAPLRADVRPGIDGEIRQATGG